MSALLETIFPIFVIVGLGYFAAWKDLFSKSAVDGLVKFTQNFAIPCLLFRAISQLDLQAITNAPLLISYYAGAFGSFGLGYLGSRLFFARGKADAVAIGFCCCFSNTILLGIPITERAYGSDALSGNFAIISFHAPLLYLVGVTAMEIARGGTGGNAQKISRVFSSTFLNPFVISILLGLIVNITSVPVFEPLWKSIDLIANAAIPTALFGLGGVLSRYKPEGDLRAITMVCLISLVAHPAIAFGSALAFGLDQASIRSAVLTASMAPGVNTYLFANMYGVATRVSAASVLVATTASIVSIWFWLLVLP